MPLLNQEEASRLFSVLKFARERPLESVTSAFSRAFASNEAVRALTSLLLLLKVQLLVCSTCHCLAAVCSGCYALQERTVLKLPERLAAHFLLWQAGRDLPLSANPFGPALVEVSDMAGLSSKVQTHCSA